MKIVITGNPEKGLGKRFADHFTSKGDEVIFVRSEDKDETIAEKLQGCKLFINNAHGKDDRQAKFLIALMPHVPMSIVIGDMTATVKPNMQNFRYTEKKRTLQNVFYNRCTTLAEKSSRNLLLTLSSSAYNETEEIMKVVDFWIDNPIFSEVKFPYKISDK